MTPAPATALRRIARPMLALRDRLRKRREGASQGGAVPAAGATPQPLDTSAASALPTLPAAALSPAQVAAARAGWADQLWDPGFAMPGGEAEIQRLIGLLPLSPATTLLLVGLDAGGAARTIVERRGAWVAAYKDDAGVAARMATALQPLKKRVAVLGWVPAEPAFRQNYHHHALLLEALRSGAEPARLLAAVAAALKPGAQLVLLELLAGRAGMTGALRRWQQLEERTVLPPDQAVVEAALRAAGFHVHVTEGVGLRHSVAAVEAWGRLIDDLRHDRRMSPGAAQALITEAEAWLLRHRLVGDGTLRLLRWHATLHPVAPRP